MDHRSAADYIEAIGTFQESGSRAASAMTSASVARHCAIDARGPGPLEVLWRTAALFAGLYVSASARTRRRHGPNGSGKTTLLKILAALAPPGLRLRLASEATARSSSGDAAPAAPWAGRGRTSRSTRISRRRENLGFFRRAGGRSGGRPRVCSIERRLEDVGLAAARGPARRRVLDRDEAEAAYRLRAPLRPARAPPRRADDRARRSTAGRSSTASSPRTRKRAPSCSPPTIPRDFVGPDRPSIELAPMSSHSSSVSRRRAGFVP